MANPTLGKQLAPPRLVLPYHFLVLQLAELLGEETRLRERGRGIQKGKELHRYDGVSAEAFRREEVEG